MITPGYQQFEINTGDDKIQQAADRLLQSLMKRMDIAKAGSILAVALSRVFLLILHTPSPLPETNITALRGLVKMLGDQLAEHEACALQNGVENPSKHQVH